jgi:hypothetical protein
MISRINIFAVYPLIDELATIRMPNIFEDLSVRRRDCPAIFGRLVAMRYFSRPGRMHISGFDRRYHHRTSS